MTEVQHLKDPTGVKERAPKREETTGKPSQGQKDRRSSSTSKRVEKDDGGRVRRATDTALAGNCGAFRAREGGERQHEWQ
jgi:hypothetical protein